MLINKSNTAANPPYLKLSIQQRLPFFMCLLLLCVVIVYSLAAYYDVRKAANKIAVQRLHSVTVQIGSMLKQSMQNAVSTTRLALNNDTIRKYIETQNPVQKQQVARILENLKKDSTWNAVALLDASGTVLLETNPPVLDYRMSFLDTVRHTSTADSILVGRMHGIKDSTYFPIYAPVTSIGTQIGYLISWRKLGSNKKNIEQVNKLLGEGSTMYIGNTDGSYWTDLVEHVQHSRVDTAGIMGTYSYSNPRAEPVIATGEYIPDTRWMLTIEFSEAVVYQAAGRFLEWSMLVGSLIIIAGTFIAWITSRNIIRPLKQLTLAAKEVTAGEYPSPIVVKRNDELKTLANAFNSMAEKVYITQNDLERQVIERTSQLLSANKELEAFTYSVSHDLRAPLRGIIGFTSILEDEYASKLDDEAKRLASVIRANAGTMGKLIDDLLNFSRLGRQAIMKGPVDTSQLVKGVISSMNGLSENIEWVIHSLPQAEGDINALRQVWVNLISNAIKYTGKKEKPRIEIGSFDHERETAFYIKDNGAGFDQKYSAKLFNVFQRLHPVNEYEGSGVGLAIVEKFISRHGGKVWAEGEVDKGATFYFTLPAGW